MEREEFMVAAKQLADKSGGGKTMTGAEATQWMARQGG